MCLGYKHCNIVGEVADSTRRLNRSENSNDSSKLLFIYRLLDNTVLNNVPNMMENEGKKMVKHNKHKWLRKKTITRLLERTTLANRTENKNGNMTACKLV
jgi:hypothetical protein